jgi:hypothetical protein
LLPKPDDLTSVVVRTDFGDDAAWEALQAALDGAADFDNATYVSDPAYAGATVQALVDADAAAADQDKIFYLFVADAAAMTGDGHPLLAVDLADEPGRTFRVPARWFSDVSNNLCIGNMDFADFANAADESGVFHGFDEE